MEARPNYHGDRIQFCLHLLLKKKQMYIDQATCCVLSEVAYYIKENLGQYKVVYYTKR